MPWICWQLMLIPGLIWGHNVLCCGSDVRAMILLTHSWWRSGEGLAGLFVSALHVLHVFYLPPFLSLWWYRLTWTLMWSAKAKFHFHVWLTSICPSCNTGIVKKRCASIIWSVDFDSVEVLVLKPCAHRGIKLARAGDQTGCDCES